MKPSRKQTRETLALLKILELSEREVARGRVKPFRAAFAEIRRRLKRRESERG